MDEDERCEGCRRYLLPLYIEPYRERNLCYQCVRAWQRLDETIQELYGRRATWQEYLHPLPSWFRNREVKLEKAMLDELSPSTVGGRQYIKH